jgi:serralysin
MTQAVRSGFGPAWKFVGSGDYLGDGRAEFLIENTSGDLVLGRIQDAPYTESATSLGTAEYAQIAALGSEWKFVGSGDVLGDGKDQFLMENAAGAVVAGEIGSGGQVRYTSVADLGSEWRFVGAGDYLGEGHDQFAIENTNGALVLGDYVGGQVRYTQVGTLGSEWSFHG